MKYQFFICFVAAAMLMTACDDTTDDIGTSLTHNMDVLDVTTSTFDISSRSIAADSVYFTTTTGHLGKIKDPETGTYVTGNFMTQFNVLEDYTKLFPAADSIISKLADGTIIADSCELRLFYTEFYGDSLATMKLTAHEMSKPMYENRKYYSTFDPKANGYIRTDGIHVSKTYTLADLSESDSTRQSSSYSPNIRILLNDEYTDRDGNRHRNFGTYLMNTYYKNPTVFGSSLKFMNEILPGFYFEHTGGVGAIANIGLCRLNIYYRFVSGDSIISGATSIVGTEEVLQTTRIENDKKQIQALIDNPTCTYLKAPAGIFTELTLPVDDIFEGHTKDSLNAVKVVLPRINNELSSDFALEAPTNLLMIPKDSLYTFFEGNRLVNNRSSYISTYSVSSDNSYVFHNISQLITIMDRSRRNSSLRSDDWNKVVLIPVTVDATGKVSHSMTLSSTRLVGGSENPYSSPKISVIYSQFK